MADDVPALIVVGRVRKPHGLKGELAIFPLTDTPDEVFVRDRVLWAITLAGEPVSQVTVATARGYHREWLLRLVGREQREAVEDLRELFLAVPRSELPALDEGEVYQQDLVGFVVEDPAGVSLGLVTAVYDLPAGLTLEVQGPAREFLLPFRSEYIQRTETATRRLVVTLPEGLLEL